jgi:Flp pilus assembly protein protease CpaA
MEILVLVLVFIYLIIATISDIRTKEIPDFLNYSFIIIGIFIYAIKSLILQDVSYFLYSLLTVIIFFTIGALMYYTKQWGGADSKLLMGIGALIPVYPSIILNNLTIKGSKYFGIDFFINMLMVGAVYALLYAISLIIKHRKEFSKKFSEIHNKNKLKIFEKTVWGAIILINVLSFFISHTNSQRVFILGISLLLLLFHYLIISIKAIEKIYVYKTIPTSKLREGDYITKELKANNKIIFKPIVHGVAKSQIKDIQKHFKEVPIKDGIAFAPTFLITLIITLLIGNIVFNLVPF